MEVNLLTPTILTSKANNTIQSNNANKVSAEQIKTDLETIINDNASRLHQNTEAANVSSANRYSDSPFLSSTLPAANEMVLTLLMGYRSQRKSLNNAVPLCKQRWLVLKQAARLTISIMLK